MAYIISFKIILAGVILSFALLFSFFIVSFGQNIFDIQFPISELGNCGSMQECKTYCDDSANASACAEWAMAKGFIKQAPLEQRGPELPSEQGPGGCRNREECDAFCSQPEHRDECFQFAKEHNMIPREEIERIEKEMNRTGPGGCRSPQECDAFCRNPDNNKTCLDFAVQEEKITREEADFMLERMKMMGPRPGPLRPPRSGPSQQPQIDEEKAKKLLETIGGPGGCRTIDECMTFCDNQENEEACFQYAVDNDLMPPQELEKIKRLRETVGPGGCVGRAACGAYCDNIDHAEECMQFAVDQGFMDRSQIEQAKKFIEIGRRGGPGGCKSPRECDAFCSQPKHMEECFNFAKDNGLMPPEEIQRMEREREIVKKLEQQGGGPGGCRGPQECHQYCAGPAHFDECVAFSVKEGMLSPDRAQTMLREFVDIEERKFEKFGPSGLGPQYSPPPGMMGPSGQFVQPSQIEEKFQERFKTFEQYQQGFQQRDDFCSKPENAEQCRQMGSDPMMPFQPGMMPPGEFPSQLPSGEMMGPAQRPIIPYTPEQGEEILRRLQQMQQIPLTGQIPLQTMPPTGEQFAPQMIPPTMQQPPTGEQAPAPPPSVESPQSGTRLQSLLGIIFYSFRELLR